MTNNYVKEAGARIIIENNIMEFDKKVLQLSNVSCLKISPVPKKEYPAWAFIAIVIGIFLVAESWFPGLFVIAVGGGCLIYIYQQNSTSGSYLVVNMNSGENFYFSCSNEDFLLQAEAEIKRCFNNVGKSIINMQNCIIENSQVGGSNNLLKR